MANRNNTFLLKRSNVAGKVPAAGDLRLGELAINTADGILYASGTTANSILPIGWDRVARTGDTMTGSLYAPSISAATISATTYLNLPSTTFSGGTVTGATIFTNGLTANTISATTYYNVSSNFQYEIHVSQIDGSDVTGDGSLLNPFATITKALTLITGQRRTIIIHPGSYTESPSITTQYTTLTGPGLIGGNILISGTLSTNVGCTISGLKMTNLTINTPTGTGNVNILNCEISGTLTKSSNADYTVLRLCDYNAANITGSGLVAIFGGNPNFTTVNNASANVILKSVVTVAPVLTAGTLSIVDSIVAAAVTNAFTSAAGTVTTLSNSQFLTSALNNVAPIVLNGFYSIFNCVFDKPNSTLVGPSGTGGSTNSIDYFQYINADKFITQGGTSSQYVMGDGSLSNGFTGGTVTGTTNFTNGLTANTISATTYFNLPTDIRVTGATYSNNTFTYRNNTGGTFNVLFNTVTGLTVNGDIIVTGNTNTKNLTATTISSTTTTIYSDLTVGSNSSTYPARITVNDSTRASITTNSGTNNLTIGTNSSGSGNFIGSLNGILNIYTVNSGESIFITPESSDGVTPAIAATASGVGINNQNPTASLDVIGNTKISGNLTATTVSATTYFNLPIDIRVTGGTYTAGTATFRNNTGGTFTVSGFSTGTSSTDTFVTGATYSNNTFTYRNNTGGTFNVLFNTVTGLTINGNITVTGTSALNGGITSTSYTGTTSRLVEASSGGTVSASRQIISGYVTDATVITYLTTSGNWTINGSYTGTSITGTYQGQNYYDDNYFYTAVADNTWIRLIRG